jgi:hypothetical protein
MGSVCKGRRADLVLRVLKQQTAAGDWYLELVPSLQGKGALAAVLHGIAPFCRDPGSAGCISASGCGDYEVHACCM